MSCKKICSSACAAVSDKKKNRREEDVDKRSGCDGGVGGGGGDCVAMDEHGHDKSQESRVSPVSRLKSSQEKRREKTYLPMGSPLSLKK